MDQMNGGQPELPKINLNDAVDVECEECGCKVFEEAMIIKKISKILLGSDRDKISPIPVLVCAKCKHINELFKPNL